MKKLIIILLLIPFALQGQIEAAHDYSFKKDKKIHVYVASGMSAIVYIIGYLKTKEAGGSFRAACMIPLVPIAGKEFVDLLAGGEFSMSDITYGTGSVLITSAACYGVTKLIKGIKKRRQRKWQQKLNIEF